MAYIRKIKSTKGNISYKVELERNGIRTSSTFYTKKDAKTWAINTESALMKKQVGVPNIKFGELLNRYAEKVTPTKRNAYREINQIKRLGRDSLSEILLPQLNEADITDWRDRRLARVSEATVRRDWSLLSSVCSIALKEWKWLEFHPMKNVRQPKSPPPRDRRISDEEIETLLYVLGYDRNVIPVTASSRIGAAFLFAIESAMRAGELVNLSWNRVDLKKQVAHLDKTKTVKRNVPLSKEAVRILNQFKNKDYDTVFGLNTSNLDALFRKAKKKAAIDNLHFHDTRHEAITRLAKKLNVLDLARMVGHKNLNQLLTYYNESASDIANKLN